MKFEILDKAAVDALKKSSLQPFRKLVAGH
jgi:hypothetical protein